jgi:16S rRNA C967 or C1407 C5-methylase (RsmB/RsmF family)
LVGRTGERILDAARAGGKTAYLAQVGPRQRDGGRRERGARRIERCSGLQVAADHRGSHRERAGGRAYDAVLVDAPC